MSINRFHIQPYRQNCFLEGKTNHTEMKRSHIQESSPKKKERKKEKRQKDKNKTPSKKCDQNV